MQVPDSIKSDREARDNLLEASKRIARDIDGELWLAAAAAQQQQQQLQRVFQPPGWNASKARPSFHARLASSGMQGQNNRQ